MTHSSAQDRTPRVAHFLFNRYLENSPPNDALRRVFERIGMRIDWFAPDFESHDKTHHPVQYGFRWLLANLLSPRWRHVDVFCCTSEDPIAVAGVLAFIWRKPLIFLADEIKAGSYRGDRSEVWKRVCRWAMRKAALTIVNDPSRITLQRQYASLREAAEVVVYPGCFLQPAAPVNASKFRRQINVDDNTLVMSFSGGCNLTGGIDWALDALQHHPELVLMAQPLAISDFERYLMASHKFADQLRLTDSRLTWQEAWSSMGGVDIGVVVYLNSAPQFQNMGVSSNRLCMFLAMGVPVIANRQASFEFIEEYQCGVLIDGPDEFSAAISTISASLDEMKANALRCSLEYIDTAGRFDALHAAITSLPR